MPCEASVQEALQLIQENPGLSIRDAERQSGAKRSTISDRQHNRLSRPESNELRRRMRPPIEQHLVDWIRYQNQICMSPSGQRTRQMGELLLQLGGEPQELGKSWYEGFRKRHPEIVCIRERAIDVSRRDSCTKAAFEAHINRIQTRISTRRIKPANIWNMDETGVSLGDIGGQYVLVDLQELRRREFFRTKAANRENVSILETISATGQFLPFLAIYKSLSHEVQADWFPIGYQEELESNGFVFSTSESGWTSNYLGIEWLRQVFLPRSKPANDDEWRLLIVDGHGSHTTVEFMYECFINKVELLFLPAHTSHITQPLDVGVFGPLKTYYRAEIASYTINDGNTAYLKRRFITAYVATREKALRRRNIEAGFRKTGIWPLEATVLLEKAFIPPSEVTIGISPPISLTKIPPENSYFGRLTPRTSRRVQLEQRRRDSDALKENRDLKLRLQTLQKEVPLLTGPSKRFTKRKRDPNEEFMDPKKLGQKVVFNQMEKKFKEIQALKTRLIELDKENVIE